jgi:hypothetical protein
MLWQTSFKICFLPLELFVLAGRHMDASWVVLIAFNGRSLAHVLVSAWETKELKVHVFHEVKFSV